MSGPRLICVLSVLLLALLAALPQQASAQAVYGSILGTVTDPSGAAVVNAKVTVINQNKGTTDTVTTNESGNYSVTHLIPDPYTVRVEATGFRIIEQKNVIVMADIGARVDLQAQVGTVTETIEVTSVAPQLQTDRADVAIELAEKQVAELPIINRNFQSMELLMPGTQIQTGWAHAATENPQGSKQIHSGGQHFSGTGYTLDGTDNQDPILGIIIINPSMDTVTETKWATQNYDAEFGKATAGIMTTQTKSGSNQFHGSGYFYELNPTGAAKDPFSNAPELNNWKQYGGTVGGPIIKNKLFFFAGYEGTRRQSGVTMTETVPTALMKSTCLNSSSAICDLSDYTNNPASGNGWVFNPYMAAGSRTNYTTYNAGSDPTKPCSTSNPCTTQIPMADLRTWDPSGVAEKILNLLPPPNATGTYGGTQANYAAGGSGSFNDYQYTGRVDYNVSQKMQIFGRYSRAHFLLSGKPVFGNSIGGPGLGYLGLAGQSQINNYSLASGFDYIFGSTFFTDFRFGFFRYNPHSTKFDEGSSTAASSLGLAGLNTSDVTTNGLPALNFENTIGQSNQGGSASGLGEGLNVGRCNCPLIEREDGYQFTNNWTKIFGNHQFKVGGDLRHAINLRVPSDSNRTGILNFNHLGTSDGSASPLGGLDVATFLFGEVTAFNRYVGSALEAKDQERQNRYFLYAQDTWRVTPALTFNYGVRWEWYGPEYVSGPGAGGFAVLPEGVIRVAGYGNISGNGNTTPNNKNFAPRVGIAYKLTPKTVVRMGYGRSFDIGVFGSNFGHTVTQNLPVLANQQLTGLSTEVYANTTAAFDFAAGAPCLPAALGYSQTNCGNGPAPNQMPVIPANGILPIFGPQNNVSPHLRPDKVVVPTVDAWNFTVQRQLTRTTSIDIAYIGTHGSHVFRGEGNNYNVNTPTIVGYGTIPYEQRAPYYNAFSTPYTDQNGVTTNVLCCDSSQGLTDNANDGTNRYKAFQVRVDQRLAKGLTFLAHYTYSKSYDSDGSYPADWRYSWGRSDFNRDSVFVFAPVYELPFGRGKQFLGNIGRVANLLVGGWQINGVLTKGSGLPWTPSYAECASDEDVGICRPNFVGGSFHVGVQRLANGSIQYFTPVAALTTPGTVNGAWGRPLAGTLGGVQRNSFTGPGEFKTDMSFFKNFEITERVSAQFRAEFFNIFNHPVYAFGPNETGTGTSIDTPGAGQINALETGTTMRQFQIGARVTF